MLHRDWLRWNERRYELMVGWEEWFETYDLLLCPAASSPAFPHDQAGERHDRTITVNGRAQPVVDQLFWAGYPCGYYLPSTVAPIGLALGLPVGIQIVGRPVRRSDLPAHGRADRGGLLPLHAAARVLKSPSAMTRRPGIDPGPRPVGAGLDRTDGAYGGHPTNLTDHPTNFGSGGIDVSFGDFGHRQLRFPLPVGAPYGSPTGCKPQRIISGRRPVDENWTPSKLGPFERQAHPCHPFP